MGWNSIEVSRSNSLFEGIDEEEGFYFLHSYYFECNNEANVLSKTFYGKSFASSVNNNNIYGVQFHPEKSQSVGRTMLKNLVEGLTRA